MSKELKEKVKQIIENNYRKSYGVSHRWGRTAYANMTKELIEELEALDWGAKTTDGIAYCADCMDIIEKENPNCNNCSGKVAWRYEALKQLQK